VPWRRSASPARRHGCCSSPCGSPSGSKRRNRRRPRPSIRSGRPATRPPSAGELSAALAVRAQFDGFERPRQRLRPLIDADNADLVSLLRWLADLTEIGPSVPPLLSVASYCEFVLRRDPLWNDLRAIFDNKTTPTEAHRLVADAAARHLAVQPRTDFLIITTNYDRLTEIALEQADVPHYVLSVGHADQYVDVRFSPNFQPRLGLSDADMHDLRSDNARRLPKNFTLDVGTRVAIVFKLHGCLFPEQIGNPPRDSVVLSDEDYIRYLMRMQENLGMIPSEITRLMEKPGFLFLGYSFSDWNVRAIYKTVVRQRTQLVTDYAVVREFSAFESKFCQERIDLLVTDLARFADRLRRQAPGTGSGLAAVAGAGRP
jgi:hypothetical protein